VASQNEVQLYHERIVETVGRIFAALDGLSDEELSWKPPAPGTNSLSVLATHMMGTLQESVVHLLGGRPLDRDREAEFAAAGAGGAELHARWERRKAELAAVFATLAPEALEREYTRPRSGAVWTGRRLLLHMAIHAGEHAGHAELTRDLLRARA
jgi:hypothetical protein